MEQRLVGLRGVRGGGASGHLSCPFLPSARLVSATRRVQMHRSAAVEAQHRRSVARLIYVPFVARANRTPRCAASRSWLGRIVRRAASKAGVSYEATSVQRALHLVSRLSIAARTCPRSVPTTQDGRGCVLVCCVARVPHSYSLRRQHGPCWLLHCHWAIAAPRELCLLCLGLFIAIRIHIVAPTAVYHIQYVGRRLSAMAVLARARGLRGARVRIRDTVHSANESLSYI